jgi:hypothetical protein
MSHWRSRSTSTTEDREFAAVMFFIVAIGFGPLVALTVALIFQ